MTYDLEGVDVLAHYGILRKSGRYPWGSGGDSLQRSATFFDAVANLKAKGLSDTEIAKSFGMTTTEFRDTKTVARAESKAADISRAQRLKEEGKSNIEIGKLMGKNESSVRSLLKEGEKDKVDLLKATSEMLRQQVAEKEYIQIGKGVENQIGVSKEKLGTAVSILRDEGYKVIPVQVPQGTSGNKTLVKVLAPPGTEYKDVKANMHKISMIGAYSEDGGRNFSPVLPPLSVSKKRVGINYAEDGGAEADGVIYVRRGKEDLSMGGSNYAQVRIAVNGTHYLKGMAMYKDDLPDGVDLVFNTNKRKSDIGDDPLAAMKPMKDDPLNPFGSVVRQLGVRDPDGRIKKVTSAMNLVNEEGDWQKWSKSLASQVLSKQSPALAKDLLEKRYGDKLADLDEIMALTNPAVRRKLLQSFSDDVDKSAVHLKAAAMPKQGNFVILPVNSLSPTQVYAPKYKDGETVVLIRFPHGGIFEIPELTVNNRHKEAKSLLGDAPDAIGIHHKVAERLSGADFDGDTVLVIPNTGSRKLKTRAPLEELKGFDPQTRYKPYDGMKTIDGGVYREATRSVDYQGKSPSTRGKGMQMGLVSNLITDMTIAGASWSELARAVKHSMVVIDAEKHKLNHRQSAIDHGIPALMKKYQGRSGGGAATLISRAKSPVDVPARKRNFRIDPATGKKIWIETGESWVSKKTGETIYKTTKSKKLAEAETAFDLISKGNTQIERVYAAHSDRMKALADMARKELVNTKTIPYNPTAAKTYSKEVADLNAKLNTALKNAPLERQARLVAAQTVALRRQANPDMEDAEVKKLNHLALEEARYRVGAKKIPVKITPDEWRAIQAGAITNHKLTEILNNADIEDVRQLATPRSKVAMSPSALSRAQILRDSGRTQAEIAEILGVSVSTLQRGLRGE